MPTLGTFDADSMDGYDTEESVSDSASAVVSELDTVEKIDDSMNEVEKRLEIASYYRLLLEDNLFSDSSEAAKRVNDEVRGFVRRRLEILVGLRAEKAEQVSQFTKEEVVALKAVAAKVMKQPVIVTPKAPEIKKVAPPPPAQIHKFEAKRKPGRPKKEEEPAKAAQPAKPVKDGALRVGDLVDSKGNVIKRGAKFKRVVMPDGSEHDLEITEQAVSPTAKPPLSKQEMEMVMEAQAHQQVASFSPSAANAAVAVITGQEKENND